MSGRRLWMGLLLCSLLVCVYSSSAQTTALPPPVGGISIADVIRLSQAGLSDNTIIAQIKMRSEPLNLTPDDLLQLKAAHVSDRVIESFTSSSQSQDANSANPAQPAATTTSSQPQSTGQPPDAPARSVNKPRVYLSAASKGSQWNAVRDQSMEMSKDFERDCPGVRVTINQNAADYSVLLNHIEHGFVRDNQIQIANKDGDLISRTKEGGSIRGDVKKACELILVDWAK